MKLVFVKSAQNESHWPYPAGAEIALAGRSNAGKSSLLNALGNQRIAKVSQSPGKTRLLNFFSVKSGALLVDMPGYGYAACSKKEKLQWQDMVESYLQAREVLSGLVLVMDIRRKWTEDEQILFDWCVGNNKAFYLVLTKADKMSRSQSMKKLREIKELWPKGDGPSEIFVVSNSKKTGIKELEKFLLKVLISS